MIKVEVEKMAKIELECEVCNKVFRREKKEDKRSVKLGRRVFCSRKCNGKGNESSLGKHLGSGNTERLNSGNREDEFSPFRYFVRKARNRKQESDIDLQYIKDLWDSI